MYSNFPHFNGWLQVPPTQKGVPYVISLTERPSPHHMVITLKLQCKLPCYNDSTTEEKERHTTAPSRTTRILDGAPWTTAPLRWTTPRKKGDRAASMARWQGNSASCSAPGTSHTRQASARWPPERDKPHILLSLQARGREGEE